MEDIFLKRLPFIDLHGYDMDSARVATNDFINENIILKNEKIVIIHGKGMGLVKKSVHETLSKRKEVIKYHTDNQNTGLTIAYLSVDKWHTICYNKLQFQGRYYMQKNNKVIKQIKDINSIIEYIVVIILLLIICLIILLIETL